MQSNAAIHMMQQWPVFMEGIDRIVGFWSDDKSQKLQGMEWLRNSLSQQSTSFETSSDLSKTLQVTREAAGGFQWLNAETLPFQSSSKTSIGQLDLFSEAQYLVLLIRIKLEQNTLGDLYYLFFRNDKSNFGINGAQEAFSTSEKAIIGRLAFQFANTNLSLYQKQKNTFRQFKKQTQSVLKSMHEQQKAQMHEIKQWKNDWIEHYLFELGERNGFNYVIQESCKESLIQHCKTIRQLKQSIEKSLVYICELFEFTAGDTIELELAYLQFSEIETPRPESSNTPQNRLSKTMLLLDRLEQSAQSTLNAGQNLTSAQVGQNMEKAISAPAISDALKKNRARILQLFSQYPDRWNCIRHQFKPIMNLKEKNTTYLSATS